MTPKKKIVEDFEKEELAPTQEPAEAPAEETKPAIAEPARLIAYAAFDFDGEHYEPGDEFIPRPSWARDLAFDEFRSVEKKNGAVRGIAFTVPGEVVNKKTGERLYHREVFPIKEA